MPIPNAEQSLLMQIYDEVGKMKAQSWKKEAMKHAE
jgi:hypothetical protein